MHVKTALGVISSYLKKGCGTPINIELPRRAYVEFHNRDITKEEIRKILEHADLRDNRCFFLLMAESGMRPYTLLD